MTIAQEDGYLPYFIFFTALMATLHSVICYASPRTSLKPFSGPSSPPHTPLLAHLYGVLNITIGAIRAYAAWEIRNKALYDLALGTYVGVIWLLGSEVVVGRTVRVGDAAVPLGVTVVGLGWMVGARGAYVG
ncbi:hypothetical protein PMIN06_002165 [Paraphaeosphaeria minitans]|uniref:Transmembrane domain-containing protein n=1 Tax=Paraphaeosphaeria minitans TaxID=565426 RepID=A0A9P6GI41_9PLEO|nr:transmembrane domain-containing protein [Paraphaeosphaeria minitans]